MSLPSLSSIRASLEDSFGRFLPTYLRASRPTALSPVLRSFLQISFTFVPTLLCTSPASLPASPLSCFQAFNSIPVSLNFIRRLCFLVRFRNPYSPRFLAACCSQHHALPSSRFIPLLPGSCLAYSSRLTPAFACVHPVSRLRSPQAVGSVFPRLVLFPTARPPLIAKLPAHFRLPCFHSSHFSFPSAFASVRTSSARLAFNILAFLLPPDLHPPSGTSARFLAVARPRLFAIRPVFQAQFAFPAASLSLAPFRRFPFPSVSFQYSAAHSCCLLFQAYRPSKLALHSPVARFLLRSLFMPYPTSCEVFAVLSRTQRVILYCMQSSLSSTF